MRGINRIEMKLGLCFLRLTLYCVASTVYKSFFWGCWRAERYFLL